MSPDSIHTDPTDPAKITIPATEGDSPTMNRIALFSGLAIMLAGIGGSYWLGHRTSTPAAYVCTNPGPDELCATDQWYQAWMDVKAKDADIAKEQESPAIKSLQDKMDQALGARQRLLQMAPQGYGWSEQKKRFVKLPPQQAGGNPLPSTPVAPTK